MTQARWARAVRALHCFALDPIGLGGVHLRSRAGDARDVWLEALRAHLTDRAQKLHPDMGDDVLFDGLDLSETLRLGTPVTREGLLSRPGLLLLPMAERAGPGLASRLAQTLDRGAHSLIALDEGADEEERLAPALAHRMGLHVDLTGLRAADMPTLAPCDGDEAVVEDPLAELTALSQRLSIGSLQVPLLALRVARVSARLDGRDACSLADLTFAAEACLAPLATEIPSQDPPLEEPPAPEDHQPDEGDGPSTDAELPSGDLLLEAAMALLPPHLLDHLAAGTTPRSAGHGAGAVLKGNRRGRPLPPRHARPDGRARIDIVATLRAAAPWQKLRARTPGGPVQVRASDIRLKRFESRSDRLLIFAVDASGSAAFARLAEAKGAVELLLAEAYARRDHVALVSFRGEGAEMLLPPTRSLVRTKRELASLPGGGGTPLAAGLRQSAEIAVQARGRGMDPALVVLTDGRPNIALSGKASRAEAAEDARAVSRMIRAGGMAGLVIDTGNRPTPALAELAREMGATCLPLPRADAAGLSRVVSERL